MKTVGRASTRALATANIHTDSNYNLLIKHMGQGNEGNSVFLFDICLSLPFFSYPIAISLFMIFIDYARFIGDWYFEFVSLSLEKKGLNLFSFCDLSYIHSSILFT